MQRALKEIWSAHLVKEVALTTVALQNLYVYFEGHAKSIKKEISDCFGVLRKRIFKVLLKLIHNIDIICFKCLVFLWLKLVS